jgi:3'(2'), 5'-bisphosphate nucleotidase
MRPPEAPASRRRALLEEVIALARVAGEVILGVYATDFAVRGKADASPVTMADEMAEAAILRGLASLTPGIPVISEEAACAGRAPAVARAFWLVDPLDGTKEFVGRNGEFTVNIALVEDGLPVLAVVLVPALARLYAGIEGAGALVEDARGRRPIRSRAVPGEGMTVVSSRSHGDAEALARHLAGRKVAASASAGSSLKFCLVAEGRADLYPRFGRTMEWDTAAGHGVLRAAGGRVVDLEGHELRYGKPGFANPHFLAFGS